jgi:hypothetical protein
MYGKHVQLTARPVMGAAPDGTARPGADLDFVVAFDPAGAGCSTTGSTAGFCTPGADVAWYVNNNLRQESVWSGYNGSLGGYVATYSIDAPQTGSINVVAGSLNDVSWTVNVSATDTSAGRVRVYDVWCGDDPQCGECCCDGSGLRIYFGMSIDSVGNGMAYVDVSVNGSVVAENQVVSTNDPTRTTGYATISCPSLGSKINVRGKQDTGFTVTLISIGDDDDDIDTCVPGTPVNSGKTRCNGGIIQNYYTTNCGGEWKNTSQSCVGESIPDDTDDSTDILTTITDFYNNNTAVSIGAVAIVGALLLFGGSKN